MRQGQGQGHGGTLKCVVHLLTCQACARLCDGIVVMSQLCQLSINHTQTSQAAAVSQSVKMVRFHWPCDGGQNSFVPPQGVEHDKDAGVTHANCEMEVGRRA